MLSGCEDLLCGKSEPAADVLATLASLGPTLTSQATAKSTAARRRNWLGPFFLREHHQARDRDPPRLRKWRQSVCLRQVLRSSENRSCRTHPQAAEYLRGGCGTSDFLNLRKTVEGKQIDATPVGAADLGLALYGVPERKTIQPIPTARQRSISPSPARSKLAPSDASVARTSAAGFAFTA